MTTDKDKGFALLKSEDNRFLLDVATANGLLRLASKKRAVENHWYYLAITKTDHGLALYIDGELEDQRFLNSPPNFLSGGESLWRLHFGAGNGGQAPLHGRLDEIGFYDRTLSAGELKALYQLRESGPCKL